MIRKLAKLAQQWETGWGPECAGPRGLCRWDCWSWPKFLALSTPTELLKDEKGLEKSYFLTDAHSQPCEKGLYFKLRKSPWLSVGLQAPTPFTHMAGPMILWMLWKGRVGKLLLLKSWSFVANWLKKKKRKKGGEGRKTIIFKKFFPKYKLRVLY